MQSLKSIRPPEVDNFFKQSFEQKKLIPLCTSPGAYCKSRIFRKHAIFVHFVRGGFRTKIKCMRKALSKSENPQRAATVRKFYAYEKSESQGHEN